MSPFCYILTDKDNKEKEKNTLTDKKTTLWFRKNNIIQFLNWQKVKKLFKDHVDLKTQRFHELVLWKLAIGLQQKCYPYEFKMFWY